MAAPQGAKLKLFSAVHIYTKEHTLNDHDKSEKGTVIKR